MAFDGIITKTVCEELNFLLKDSKVTKIFEPNKEELIFSLYKDKKNYLLNIVTTASFARVALTNTVKENPFSALNFCMLLRKHLLGYKIISITCNNLERVIEITFEGYNELNDLTTKKLFLEIMGKFSNVILTNSNNIIIDTLKHINTKRELYPARLYEFPENNKISFINISNFNEFYDILNFQTNIDLAKQIADVFIGISTASINGIIKSLNISKENITKQSLEQIYNYLKQLLSSNYPNLSILEFNQNKKDDYCLIIKNKDLLPFSSEILTKYYTQKELNIKFINQKNNLLKNILSILKKYENRLENINKKLSDCSNMDNYKLFGELITANLYNIKNINSNELKLFNYYTNQDIIVPIDKSISASKNAEKYYKKYNKCKNTINIVSKQKLITESELEYIESLIFTLENTQTLEEIEEINLEIAEIDIFKNLFKNTKKTKKEKITFLEFNINGYQVIVGKNNLQNDLITFKLSNKTDIWFHAQNMHGSHVVLKTNNKTNIDNDTILKCARLAALNSKANSTKNVAVDYTQIKNVKRNPLNKPGLVIYTNYKTIFC